MEWKEHPVINGYVANINGEIARKVDGKIIKQSHTKIGYLVFGCNGKTRISHRFIYECFYGLIPDGMVIDHINTVRDDNKISNLKCCSTWDNNHNQITMNKLKNREGTYVLVRDKETGKIVNWFQSIKSCARFYNTDKNHIYSLLNNLFKNKHKDYGCVFEYTEEKYTKKWDKWWITL